MSYNSAGLNAAALPRDSNLNPINAGSHIQIVKDSLTGASGAGDTFSIAVPDGAIEVEFYVLSSALALLPYTINDIQGSPATAFRPTTLPPLTFGCTGHATIAGSVATGDLADAATATAVAIFKMGKAV